MIGFWLNFTHVQEHGEWKKSKLLVVIVSEYLKCNYLHYNLLVSGLTCEYLLSFDDKLNVFCVGYGRSAVMNIVKVFWIKSCRLSDITASQASRPLASFNFLRLTSRTAPGSKRVWVMLTQLGLRLLPGSCLVTGKGKWASGQPNNAKPDPAEATETCLGFSVLQPAELRTTAGRILCSSHPISHNPMKNSIN